MIYIYRRHNSTGARELANALTQARRVRDLQGVALRAGDTVICWGESWGGRNGVQVINGAPLRNKFEDTRRLTTAGVATVEVSQTRPYRPEVRQPAPVPMVDPARVVWAEVQDVAGIFAGLDFARSRVSTQAVSDLGTAVARLQTVLHNPAPRPVPPPRVEVRRQEEWLARTFNHQGGTDLLRGVGGQADYYSKKENLVDEYRVHIFNGRSIRAGRKVGRQGVRQHPWIRSYDGGWRINYDGFESTRTMRDLSQRAVEALGLQFGAVDLGQKPDGSMIVLEVNRAPGLEGGTVTSYATAVERLMQGEAPRQRRNMRRE